MSTSAPSRPAGGGEAVDRKRKCADTERPVSKWRTRREHEIYSSRLLDALRRVRGADDGGGGGSGSPPKSRVVRDAANRALAVAARGRSRWSRALLVARARKLRGAAVPSLRTRTMAKEKAPAAERKAMVLGRLVPGCQKLSLPTLLEETTDYIAALQMQIRTMGALAEILAVVTGVEGGGGGGGGGAALASSPV